MAKKLERFLLADKIRSFIGSDAKKIKQNGNFYFLGDSEDNYQLEFIPQSKRYFFTIRFTGLIEQAEQYHTKIADYLKSLQLGRNIQFTTEITTTII
jgi:hypothetical protein